MLARSSLQRCVPAETALIVPWALTFYKLLGRDVAKLILQRMTVLILQNKWELVEQLLPARDVETNKFLEKVITHNINKSITKSKVGKREEK